MNYTAVDTFYLTDDQLHNSPSRQDGIDKATETTLRIYGCDLIQESGILLRLSQQVMGTGQVLLHRFYCKTSFAQHNVKRMAAACVWLASRLGENPRRARAVINVFQRMECRREKLPLEHLDASSQEMYLELKKDLSRCERHILKELGFVCHVELPHKLMLSYITVFGTPPGLMQEAWNLANDSLRTTLCVRLKPEVVACGVLYAAARRVHVPLPENPPWWEAFDADKMGIDEVCRVLAHLYSQPKAQYLPICRKDGSFTCVPIVVVANTSKVSSPAFKDALKDGSLKINAALAKLLVRDDSSTKSDDGSIPVNQELKAKVVSKQHTTTIDRSMERERKKEKEKEKERHTSRAGRRGRDYHEKQKRYSSRDRGSSYSKEGKENRHRNRNTTS